MLAIGNMFVCRLCGGLAEREGFCKQDGARLEPREDALVGASVGSYRLTRLIGRGGMGFVYLGVHPSIGSRVAIKVLGADWVGSQELVQRFFDEARAVNLIRHEHIVNILDLAHLPDGRPYIVMEYLDGTTLRAAMDSQRLPFGQSIAIIGEVLDALAAAHQRGVVHRDIKPENIFVTPGGHAKVLDFGIAKLRPDLTGDKPATRTGVVMGTPHYMSPEQALGGRLDATTDVYSLGVILYEVLTGTRPFDAPSVFGLIQQHVGQPPPPPSSRRQGVPLELERVVLAALEKDPRRRFPTAVAMKDALFAAYSRVGAATGPAACRALPLVGGSVASEASYPYGSPHGQAPQPTVVPAMAAGVAPPAFGLAAPTAPQAPGEVPAQTYAPGFAPHPVPRPPAKPGTKRWAALIMVGCAGLGVLTAVGVAGLYYAFVRASINRAQEVASTAATANESEALSGLAAQLLSQNGSIVLPGMGDPSLANVSVDLKAFDPYAFLPKAVELAREHHADAQLTRIHIDGLRSNGVVDLTANDDYDVFYSFRSPSRSIPPASHPTNVVYEGPCIVTVYVDEDGVRANPGTWECDELVVPLPKCSPSLLWSKAAAQGAPTGNVIGNLSYFLDDDTHQAEWYLSIPPKFSQSMPDRC